MLAANISTLARQEKASLIVLKEFPAEYRDSLSCFLARLLDDAEHADDASRHCSIFKL